MKKLRQIIDLTSLGRVNLQLYIWHKLLFNLTQFYLQV